MKEERMLFNKYDKFGKYFYYHFYSETECHLKYAQILRGKFNDIEGLKVMEIGAGHGYNLLYFKYLGMKWENIYANDILPERIKFLKEHLLLATIHECDAEQLSYTEHFDVVMQSTVFTSVLNDNKKEKLADKMFLMAKKGGIILWYDFRYNNPKNKNVKGIKKDEIKWLFPKAEKIDFYRTTLAPPIGRIAGRLYPIVNKLFVPFRSHLIAVIHK